MSENNLPPKHMRHLLRSKRYVWDGTQFKLKPGLSTTATPKSFGENHDTGGALVQVSCSDWDAQTSTISGRVSVSRDHGPEEF